MFNIKYLIRKEESVKKLDQINRLIDHILILILSIFLIKYIIIINMIFGTLSILNNFYLRINNKFNNS